MVTPNNRGLGTIGSTILLVLILTAAFTPIGRADYNIKITGGNDKVNVEISGSLLQGVPNPPEINATDALPFGRIPVFNTHLINSNASDLSTALNSAIKEKTPGASADSVSLDADSNGTIYAFTLRFDVSGISMSQSDTVLFDMSWKSFVLRNDLTAGNRSLNDVLPKYLQPSILVLAQEKSTPANTPGVSHVLRWWWNGQQVDRNYVGSLTPNAKMFNFSTLSQPIDQWQRTTDFERRITKYVAAGGFNLTFTDLLTEVTESATISTNAVYKLKSSIEAPWGSNAIQDSLIVEAAVSSSTLLMLGIIVASIVLLTGALLLERRYTGHLTSANVKKSKR